MHRSLPSTVEIGVIERRPIVIARLGSELFLVDEDAVVIDTYGPRYAGLDLPVVDGLGAGPAKAGAALNRERMALAARLLEAVGSRPDLARRISQVDVSDPRDAVVTLERDPVLVRLGEEQFVERLQSYLELAPSLLEQVPEIESVDLRFGEHVYVGAAGRASGRRTAQSDERTRPPAGG